MENKKNLIDELHALLNKYEASISWGCHWSSDMHGITGQYMEITERKKGAVLKIDGASITAYEIEINKEG